MREKQKRALPVVYRRHVRSQRMCIRELMMVSLAEVDPRGSPEYWQDYRELVHWRKPWNQLSLLANATRLTTLDDNNDQDFVHRHEARR